MNDRKLIRQALDALEEVNQWRRTGIGRPPEQTSMDVVDALRERLAQPDQEVCQNSELAPDRNLPAQQKPTVDDDRQDWRGMDGAIAWHLIDRHADGWSDVGKMMGEWLEANQPQPAQQEPVAGGREVFEQIHGRDNPAASFRKLDNGDYLCGITQSAWEGWRACATHHTAQQEPVYFCDYGYEGWGKVDADMAAANIANGMTVEVYYTSPPAIKPLTDDPLQGAVDWLLEADGEYFCTATVQRTLRIGYNRAKRLCDTAKERAAHGIKGDA